MDENLKLELSLLENQIKETLSAKSDTDLFITVKDLSGNEKELVRFLLGRRQEILNSLLMCTPAEVDRIKDVNDRLLSLTNSLKNKTYRLYKALLQTVKFREEMLQEDPSLEEFLKMENIAVAALLHDVCKMDEYKIKADGTPAHKEPNAILGGHGYKSIVLLLFQGFRLTGDEILAIRWHMGAKYIKDPKEKKECEKAKKDSPLTRLIIRADHAAATSK